MRSTLNTKVGIDIFMKLIFTALSVSVLVFVGCSSGGDKKETKEAVNGSAASGGNGGPASSEKATSSNESDTPKISSDRKLLVNSLTNNGFTSKTVNKSKAADMASEFSKSKSKEPQVAYGAIVANRIAGKPPQESFDDGKRVMDELLSKRPDADLPESIQLEIALSALQNGKLALAEFFLDKLTSSKNNRVKAAATNALGVVAIRTERVPEAVAIFKEALKADKEYEPALLNIGFLALQGGDAATAKRALGAFQNDWMVESAFVSIERLEGDVGKAEQKCEKILAKHPKHKPTLINCGINAYQGTKDFKRAREYFNRALAVAGGLVAWDEKTGRLLGVVDREEVRAGQEKSAKEAEERAAKANAEKAKEESSPAKREDGAAPQAAPAPAPGGP
ncbi:MAG: hypothetical protein NT027_11620 [Proteobacteria bacterium]|nr:hypothetical protein [Pseudomonadota bacterium]